MLLDTLVGNTQLLSANERAAFIFSELGARSREEIAFISGMVLVLHVPVTSWVMSEHAPADPECLEAEIAARASTPGAMRSLVTGGAGFIGSSLVDVLLDRGDDVTIIDNLSSGREQNLSSAFERGAQLRRVDVVDAAAVYDVFADVRPERVFHLAAQIDVRVSMQDPARDLLTNVGGTINVLEAARAFKTGRLVFASTGGAIYGDTDVLPTGESASALPMAPYGQSKFCAERYLALYERVYGLSSITLRFSNVYGPRLDPDGEAGVVAIFCGRLRDGRAPTIYGDGSQTRDYLYVGDLTSALIAASELAVRGVLNVGTRHETSVLDVVRLLGDIHGDGAARPDFKPARPGEVERSRLDASRARDVLGWEASTSIQEGLRRTYAAALH